MFVKIELKDYEVNKDEFNFIVYEKYENLKILKNLGLFERLISLFGELKFNDLIKKIYFFNTTHGGFIPIECAKMFDMVYLLNTTNEHKQNITNNISLHKLENIYQIESCDYKSSFNYTNYLRGALFFSENSSDVDISLISNFDNVILITKYNDKIVNSTIFNYLISLKDSDYYIYLNDKFIDDFKNTFNIYIEENQVQQHFQSKINDSLILNYDNLIHLCIMVKNGGKQFEDTLKENLHLIDRWTILDTGSTDDTIDTINRNLVNKKRGELFQEPFINFRDSRNRLLDLAGNRCKYIIMLDDTYIVQKNLRGFLNKVRGDQYSSSFTTFIQTNDTIYGSNRIIKTSNNLRYINTIHEVITDKNNVNIIIPEEDCLILDKTFDYMAKRTMDRKKMDLVLLYKEIEEDPMNARTYYYLGQTYNVLEEYEKAFYYYMKRAEFVNSGFIQERVDAVFEAARIANFKLNKPWEECEKLYLNAYKIDETRPESLYFIGIHYYLENNFNKAYQYFKNGFELGFPVHCQYSLKPTLSFYFLPMYLTKICYLMEDYNLGLKSAELFLLKNKPDCDNYEEILSWYKIYEKLVVYNNTKTQKINVPEKPLFCFVADGGFNKWSGKNILTSGVGGSETYIIEMARYIQKSGLFNVYVFCNCEEEEIFENVQYKNLSEYYSFINENYIHTCIVSRYSEYLPLTFKGHTENVYFVIHDLTPSGIIIPLDKKLKHVFCLTEWHVKYFTNIFPQLKDITVPFYYGCNFKENINVFLKEKYKFIYSSFPNRGLLELLQIWPKIYNFQPLATLHIYSDVENKWSNDVEPEKMNKIKELLQLYSNNKNNMGINYHGWVKKSVLKEAWRTSEFWFYPCTFMETFCLTALEAASTKTLAITNNLAALQNTVGDRGIIISGDPTTDEWKVNALNKIIPLLTQENNDIKNELIERNYQWAMNLTWENQANKLLNEYILKYNLEYKGMYNWTNDVPIGTKDIFLKNIKYFNDNYVSAKNGKEIQILEIGSYSGISLIELIKNIPNSYGIGIDMWSSYDENKLLENMDNLKVEKSFYKNISTAGLNHRIKGIKSDSTTCLLRFIEEKKTVDFIYIDGSHKLLDLYSDLILSWKILERNGLLLIDDYTYLKEKNEVLNSPYEGVNHFLNKYKDQYKLLDIGYRVFLQKL